MKVIILICLFVCHVSAQTPTKIVLPDSLWMRAGESKSLDAKAYDATGKIVNAPLTFKVAFPPNGRPSIDVSSIGTVSALISGSATIYATSGGAKSNSTSVIVLPAVAPTPSPSPTPSPQREVLDVAWPNAEKDRTALWAQTIKDGWQDCFPYNNKLRCWRVAKPITVNRSGLMTAKTCPRIVLDKAEPIIQGASFVTIEDCYLTVRLNDGQKKRLAWTFLAKDFTLGLSTLYQVSYDPVTLTIVNTWFKNAPFK